MVYHLFEGEVEDTSSKNAPSSSPTKKIVGCYLSARNCVRVASLFCILVQIRWG